MKGAKLESQVRAAERRLWQERGFFGPERARVLLVGEAPSRAQKRLHHSLMRPDLAELAGVSYPAGFFRLFARTNLLPEWPGRAPSGKGDAWKPRTAERNLRRIYEECFWRFERVVLLGRRVQAAFDAAAFPLDGRWFAWTGNAMEVEIDGELRERRVEIAVAPHPSKVSHWWNSAVNREAAGHFWRELARFAAEKP